MGKMEESYHIVFTSLDNANNRHDRLFDSVSIALVGKYTNLQDSYISVIKSLEHASLRCNRKLHLRWVDSSDLEPETLEHSPVKYHIAWGALCSAKYVPYISHIIITVASLFLVVSGLVEPKE